MIDTGRGIVTETIATALFPKAPEGSTPDALAVAPDGKTLYVANADNNCVAVIDIAAPGRSQVKGFIPTGWYPTAVAVTPDGKTLLVGVGKGNQTKPNPIEREDRQGGDLGQPRGGGLAGRSPTSARRSRAPSRSSPVPDDKTLAAYTETVYRNCPYSDKLLTDAPHPEKTAIPTKVGDPSPIKHVIYIIKENRTYDQVFGDMPRGNGDPSLVMFGARGDAQPPQAGRGVRPARQPLLQRPRLGRRPPLVDDGLQHRLHRPQLGPDLLEPRRDRRRRRRRPGQGPLGLPLGRLRPARPDATAATASTAAASASPTARSGWKARVPGLVGHMCPDFGVAKVPGRRGRDTDNVDIFLKEFREFEKNGTLPRFIVMSLGEDHTTGTTPGTFTPQACVASNDLALGRLVEAVTQSKFWPETAIFVIEDDAQNGPDHVDAHRTVGLVISPYTKRQAPRQHAVQHREHDPDDGADPRPAAPEPVRRRRHGRCSPRSPTRPT